MASTSPKAAEKQPAAPSSPVKETKDTKETVEASASTSEAKSAESSKTPATAESTEEDDAADDGLPEVGEVPKDPKGIIEMDTFQQIRDMDDDDDEDAEDGDPREFSRGIVFGFFDQAEQTFKELHEALAEKDLERLSSLGHFLKGSSAALGIIKVQAICEKIQHFGHKHDEDQHEMSEDEALKRIKQLLVESKKDYAVAKAWLVNLYESGE